MLYKVGTQVTYKAGHGTTLAVASAILEEKTRASLPQALNVLFATWPCADSHSGPRCAICRPADGETKYVLTITSTVDGCAGRSGVAACRRMNSALVR